MSDAPATPPSAPPRAPWLPVLDGEAYEVRQYKDPRGRTITRLTEVYGRYDAFLGTAIMTLTPPGPRGPDGAMQFPYEFPIDVADVDDDRAKVVAAFARMEAAAQVVIPQVRQAATREYTRQQRGGPQGLSDAMGNPLG